MTESERGRVHTRPMIVAGLDQKRHSQYLPMTDTEAWTFLKVHYKMILSSLDSYGLPHATPVWYVVIGNRIFFRAQPYKKKINNILNKPQVCGVVEDGEKYTELRGVMIQGLAKVVDTDKVLRKQVFDLLAEKYRDRRDTYLFPKTWQEKYGKEHRVIVQLTPTNIVSWDNRKWISQQKRS